MVRRSTPRAGITLIEVLAAIFIMGVGLLALFTLFPLGALSMARAVREDRAAAIGANAASMATAMDLRNDPGVTPFLGIMPAGPTISQTGPGTPPNPPLVPVAPFNFPDPNGPGFPVLVDPTYAALGQSSLGAVPGVTPGIQRCGANYASGPQNIARWFTFLEEMTFTTTGQPKNAPASVERPGTYTWTYLLRRPKANRPDLVEMSVLVYANRAVEVSDGEQIFPQPASPASVIGTKGTNTVSFNYNAGSKPNIRRGAWIMDVSYSQKLDPVTGSTFGTVNGFAYRVENVTDTGATNLTLEVDPALKADMTTLVVLENVIAVIDRSTTWKP
jgi:type II secretory pathway pseudopilin PulG